MKKGFIYLGEDVFLNEDVVEEVREYFDNIIYITKYDEKFKVKKDNKNGGRK